MQALRQNTETYRSGHNGADSKSVREQSPASSNLAVSAKKKKSPVGGFFFLVTLKRDSNQTLYRGPRKVVRLFGERTSREANYSNMQIAFCFVSAANEDAVSAKK